MRFLSRNLKSYARTEMCTFLTLGITDEFSARNLKSYARTDLCTDLTLGISSSLPIYFKHFIRLRGDGIDSQEITDTLCEKERRFRLAHRDKYSFKRLASLFNKFEKPVAV